MLTVVNQPLPLWPYFALALLTGALGAVFLYYNLGSTVPAEQSLQKVSGTVDKVFLIDDLSGASTSIMKPLNSVHFTLAEVEGEFRYPSGWPGYNTIWRQLSFHVDVWVRRSDIGSGEPMVVFRLEQQVPENWIVEPFSISYAQIADSQNRNGQSYVEAGAVLLASSAAFVSIAFLVRIWNRRKRNAANQLK